MKPWKHATIAAKIDHTVKYPPEDSIDLIVGIECRNKEGERLPERDLELEVFESGKELNLVLSWLNNSEKTFYKDIISY